MRFLVVHSTTRVTPLLLARRIIRAEFGSVEMCFVGKYMYVHFTCSVCILYMSRRIVILWRFFFTRTSRFNVAGIRTQ